ncbi:50S ribosomal protein L10 [Candidatus Woesearchaeota archaeon]|nr:50S ribosomal protein L10 [Candidatus Woesearchaeota archaeon]
MAEKHKAHVQQYKKEQASKVVDLLFKYPIIGVLNMENLPAAQEQKIRLKLRGTVELAMTKKRLFKIAFEEAVKKKPELSKLIPELKGMPALLFTRENPFSLYKLLKRNKSPAAAKAGQKAPYDLKIPAGPTPFAPGPVISELAALGLKTKVDAGKINIVADTVVCKEGQPITDKLASMLMRLGITPMEVGLDLACVLEGDQIFKRAVLDIDEKKFFADMISAIQAANNLSIEAAYPTKENRELLIQKAARHAISLSIESGFITKDTACDILAKGKAQAQSVADAASYQPT